MHRSGKIHYYDFGASVAPECTLLRLADVPRTIDTLQAAFQDNPLGHYIKDTPDSDQACFPVKRTRANFGVQLVDCLRRRAAYTIDNGDAVIQILQPLNSLPLWQRNIESCIRTLRLYTSRALMSLNSKEQKKRSNEVRAKFEAAIEKIGLDGDEMIYIDGLAVTPEKQGLGYGTALMQLAIKQADAHGRRVWLGTVQPTDGFYEHFGFSTVISFELGENNPTWTEPPVVFCIMVRSNASEKAR